jgi:hypothetical protein
MVRFVIVCTRERVIRAAVEAADCDASREIMVQICPNNEQHDASMNEAIWDVCIFIFLRCCHSQ